ncbi:MAG: ATP-binding protein [Pseudomonadota bacterium]
MDIAENSRETSSAQEPRTTRPESLWRRYAIALCVIIALACCTFAAKYVAAAGADNDAAAINISGRQRMLSQRILILADEHSATQNAASAAELRSAIDLFENSNALLTSRGDLSTELRQLYFEPRETALDAQSRAYAENARRLLSNPDDGATLNALREVGSEALLNKLDMAVAGFEAQSKARIAFLSTLENISLAALLVTILVEVMFIFLPGHRTVVDALAKLRIARDELEIKNNALRQQKIEIVNHTRALRLALEESESLRKEQAEFTYSVSHDMKAPANTIKLLLNEIAFGMEKVDQDTANLLKLAQGTIDRMTGLVEDVLVYSRTVGRDIEMCSISLPDVIEQITADLRSEIETSGASIHVGPLPVVRGNPMQVRMLLQNLIANAIKFRKADTTPEIRITCENNGEERVVLSVRDNGIGIDPQNHERIFSLFERLHVRTEYPGSGLGLTLCKRIIANHGGNISVESSLGEGAAFNLSLERAA